MIEESQADKFMDRIYSLVTSSLRTTKGMDVILLMGGTGNGKSTILNMMAGSQITATENQEDRSWEFQANPQIALIGHVQSMTFVPNYWEGNGFRIYDCPGFKDTRDIEHQIVKSFFIKEIADNAKSIKVIIVSSFNSIYDGRCILFQECINQLKQFIPNFDANLDYSLFVTKGLPKFDAKNISVKISKHTQKHTKIELSPERITIVYQPIEEGIYDTSKINFEEAIKRTPTISGKCSLPISSDARLKLMEISKQLNHSVEKAIKLYSKYARLYYLQVLANNLEASNDQIHNIYQLFKKIQSDIKDSQTGKQFLKNMRKYSQKLSSDCGINFNYVQICNFIQKKLNHIYFIKEKIDYFQINFEYWVQSVNFQCPSFTKSNNNTNLKNFDIFASFLVDSFNIDINSDLKNQAHAYLLKRKNITVAYSGSTRTAGNLTTSGICRKSFRIPYIAEVTFNISLPYSGQAKYSGQKTVSGTVRVPRCSCGYDNWFGKGKCLNCNHSDMDLSYTKSVSYNGYVSYSGRINKSIKEKSSQIASFQKEKTVNVSVPYNENVNYSGNHTGCCQSHHHCSCNQLASLALNAKEIYQDILFYYQIQAKQIKQLNNGICQEVMNIQLDNTINKFNFEGYTLTNRQLKEKDIADRIHSNLTCPNIFSANCSGYVDFKIQKMYHENVKFEGYVPVSKTIDYDNNFEYSGVQYYNTTQSYSGSVERKSCYEGCSWCNITYHTKYYQGSTPISGSVHYSGSVPYSGRQNFNSNVSYDQYVPFVGTLSKNQNVPYNKTIQITCPENNVVGEGHHSCSSCQTWEKFIEGMKKLLQIKKEIKQRIGDNRERLRGIISLEQ